MEAEPIKVEKWDQNAVRIALDDAAKKVVLDLGYEENHKLVDTRLIICTLAVLAAGLALVWDFLYPFPASKTVIITCVASYIALMGVLTIYTSYIEQNIFLIAHQKDPIGTEPDVVWTMCSYMAKYDKFYSLSLKRTEVSKEGRVASIKTCVGKVFDINGELHMDVFTPMVMDLHKSLLPEKKSE